MNCFYWYNPLTGAHGRTGALTLAAERVIAKTVTGWPSTIARVFLPENAPPPAWEVRKNA